MTGSRAGGPDVLSLLRGWSGGWPDRAALWAPERQVVWTFGRLAAAVADVVQVLQAAGVGAGDRVAFWMTDRPAVVVLLWAVMEREATWVPVNHRFTAGEAVAQLRHARASVLVVEPARWPEAQAFAERLPDLRLLMVWGGEDADPPVVGMTRPTDPAAATDPVGVGILYTSGTTGQPKATIHDRESLAAWCLAMAHAARWTWADRVAVPYPLFHMGGVGFALTVLAQGATAVLTGRPAPAQLLPLLAETRASSLVAPPTVLNQLVRLPEAALAAFPLPDLAAVVTTSAPLWDETAGRLRTQWPGATLTEVYSATEAVFTFLPAADRDARPRSVGRPAWGMEVAIRDSRGRPLPPYAAGLIWTRGHSVFRGYLPPAAEALPLADGWHTCRDVGYLDGDGYLYIIDRETDLINSGGEKISSGEVENLLLQHPAVLEAAVIGVPDAVWGERVHAVVALRPDPEATAVTPGDILAWCEGRLAAFKLPKTLRIVNELPKSPVGKLLKRVLRAAEGAASAPS